MSVKTFRRFMINITGITLMFVAVLFFFSCDDSGDSNNNNDPGPAMGRLCNYTYCQVYSAEYGTTVWNYLLSPCDAYYCYCYEYKNVYGANNAWVEADNGSGGISWYYTWIDEPEPGKKYTFELTGSCGSYYWNVVEDY